MTQTVQLIENQLKTLEEYNMNKIFADGLIWQDPHEKAPDFIKGQLIIKPEKFIEFMKQHMEYCSPKGWIKIDLKESQNKTMYFELNTWKPKPEDFKEVKDKITSPSEDYPEGIDMENHPLDDNEEIPF